MKELRPDDTIGIVSPASAPDRKTYQFCQEFLESRGFRVKFFGRDAPPFGRMAASDRARLDNLHAAFRDPEVDAILCTRGGYGTIRLLDGLDYDLVRGAHKIFVGYSDITNLLVLFSAHAGLTPFHGPMLIDLMSREDAWTIERFFDLLMNRISGYELNRDDFQPLRNGAASGRLCGGNVTILESLTGTEPLRAEEPRILFLEDVGEYMYRLDRSLVHLKRCGLFENLAGVLLADMHLKDGHGDNSLGISLEELITMHFGDLGVPVAMDLPCGHTSRQMTLPVGVETTLEVTDSSLSLSFGKIWDRQAGTNLVA